MRVQRRSRLTGVVIATATLIAAAVTLPATSAMALPTPTSSYTTSQAYTGSTYVNMPNISSVAALSTGTIVSRFKTTAAGVKALFSASNTSLPSTNLTLSVNDSNLYFESRDSTGAYQTKLQWPLAEDRAGRLNDGQWHTAVVTVTSTGTRIYVDGYQVHAGTSTAFFDKVPGINSVKVGANQDSGGVQWGFVGDIAATYVYGTALTDAEILSLYPAPDTVTKWTPDVTYASGIALVNKLPSSSSYNLSTTGTIVTSFTTTASGVQAIVSAADTSAPSSNLTLALNGGALYYENRSGGTYAAQITVPGHWNDGNWHTVAVRVNDTGTVLFADGVEVARHASTAFMSSVTGINGLWLGGNIDSGGEQWKFTGQIGKTKLFTSSLTESDIKNLSDEPLLSSAALFDSGYASSSNYRIPSMLKTAAGTLIAGADQRKSSSADSPNDINFAIRRSTDGGATWSAAQVLLDYPGTGENGASVIDSVLVQDATTGRIFAVIDRFPGGGGQANAQVGTGFDSGKKRLFDSGGAEFRLDSSGVVTTAGGAATSYSVAANGDVTASGSPAGNIHTKPGVDPAQALYEYRTAYMVVIHSDDEGATWSQPVDITTQVKADWMRFIGNGPGSGIQLKNGTHAGRILVPIYFNNATSGANIYSSAMIYSDDGGATWQRSTSPNDGRVYGGVTYNSQALNTTSVAMHEPTIVEQTGGNVLMLVRNLTPGGKIVASTTTDGGATWSAVTQQSALPDPFSQPNAIEFDTATTQHVMFANATARNSAQSGGTRRGTGVVRISNDEGATWAFSKTFRSDSYVYNNLVQLDATTFGLFWELENQGLYFTKVPLIWLTSSGR